MTSTPIRIEHRGAGTRYASTHRVEMRDVAQGLVLAVIFLALVFLATVGLGMNPIGDQCANVMAGTDHIPADVLLICQSAPQ